MSFSVKCAVKRPLFIRVINRRTVCAAIRDIVSKRDIPAVSRRAVRRAVGYVHHRVKLGLRFNLIGNEKQLAHHVQHVVAFAKRRRVRLLAVQFQIVFAKSPTYGKHAVRIFRVRKIYFFARHRKRFQGFLGNFVRRDFVHRYRVGSSVRRFRFRLFARDPRDHFRFVALPVHLIPKRYERGVAFNIIRRKLLFSV